MRQSVALLLAADGASLSLADMNEAGLEETKKACEEAGAKAVLILKTNVTKREDVQAWMAQTKENFGQLDGVCNAAGQCSIWLGWGKA